MLEGLDPIWCITNAKIMFTTALDGFEILTKALISNTSVLAFNASPSNSLYFNSLTGQNLDISTINIV